jgi:hypothetical protein
MDAIHAILPAAAIPVRPKFSHKLPGSPTDYHRA